MSDLRTLADLVFHVREHSAGRTVMSVSHPQGDEVLSTSEFLRSIHTLALAMESRGLRPGERVAIFSENRPEWHVVDLACQLLGAPTVPLHPELPAEQVAFILRNSGSRWLFFSDLAKRDLLLELRDSLTQMPTAIAFDSAAALEPSNTLTLWQGEGAQQQGSVPLERFRDRARPGDLASIIYTSGTTGDPKGVMLAQRNLVANFLACADVFRLTPKDLSVSFLPLSHIFQRTMDHLCLFRGVRTHFVPFFEDVPAAVRQHRPTVLAAAPSVYERSYRRTLERVEGSASWRRQLFHWAVAVGKRYAQTSREGFIGPILATQRWLADAWVYRGIKERFGGRLELAISGGESLNQEVSEFFEAVGIPLYQGYGLTETSPVLATNRPDEQRQGSVGKAVSDVELRIAEDGEILVRGPGMMQGYWQNSQATAASVNESGWFRTGDLGRIDKSGYIFVTDRKRDLLTTSNGHQVTPRPIELLLTHEELVSQAVVVGDGRPHAAALLVPDFDKIETLAGKPAAEALSDPQVRAAIGAAVDRVNERLLDVSQVRSWALLDRPLSVENGELTPSQKLRRRAITQRFAAEISALYGSGS